MKAVNDRELRINYGDVTCTLDVSIKEKDVSLKVAPIDFLHMLEPVMVKVLTD